MKGFNIEKSVVSIILQTVYLVLYDKCLFNSDGVTV